MISVMALRFVGFVQSCLENYQRCYRTLFWHLQRYQRTLSWRYHKLRKAPKRSQPISPSNPILSDGLHRLPPEIRLQIYGYLFPRHYVVQPEFDHGRLRVRFGLLATAPTNHADHLGDTLRMTLEDGGSFLHQTSPRLPSTKMAAGRLICGDGEAWYMGQCPGCFGDACTSLLRTSTIVYREVVHILYSMHTFSFFGPEMLQLFLDQASFEGLRSVRHVHLAVPVPSHTSSMENALDHLAQTMSRVKSEMIGLQHLEVEIVVHQGPPQDPTMLWRHVSNIFGQLQMHSLEKFVLKGLVLRKGEKRKGPGSREGVLSSEHMERWRIQDVKGFIYNE